MAFQRGLFRSYCCGSCFCGSFCRLFGICRSHVHKVSAHCFPIVWRILSFLGCFMKRWYVVQVYAGYEERVKKDIQSLIAKEGLEDFFGEVLIPSAKLKPLFDMDATD